MFIYIYSGTLIYVARLCGIEITPDYTGVGLESLDVLRST